MIATDELWKVWRGLRLRLHIYLEELGETTVIVSKEGWSSSRDSIRYLPSMKQEGTWVLYGIFQGTIPESVWRG